MAHQNETNGPLAAIIAVPVMSQDNSEIPEMDPDIERELDDLAHALRSPLTALRGGLELVNEFGRDGLDDVAVQGLDVAISATRRLTALIDATLLLTRFRTGQLELVLSVEPATEVVRDTLQFYRNQRSSLEQEAEVDAADVEVVADVELLAGVFGRLIELTVEPTGRLGISAHGFNKEVAFKVSTDAPLKARPNRASDTVIAAARAVIEQHHGTLTINGSDPTNAGPVFSFTLPQAD